MNISVSWPWPLLLVNISAFGFFCGVGEAAGQEVLLRYRTRKLKERLRSEGRSVRP
jgi:hypothetical protein